MKIDDKYNSMAHGSSRAQTRSPEVLFDSGSSSVKKLLGHFDSLHNVKNSLKKFSICNDKRCKTCPLAGKEQIVNDNLLFCKASNVVYYIECNICNLGYVGQTSNSLNIRINGHRSDIKNLNNKNCNDIEIKHFQLHSFNNVKLYILDIIPKLEDRLSTESLYICKLNTLYPYGLNSNFNGSNICSNKDSSIYGKFKIFSDKRISNYRGCRGKGNNNKNMNILNVIDSINLNDLHFKDIKVIKSLVFSLKNKAIIWFLKYKFKKYKFKNQQVRDIFIDLCKFRLKVIDINIFSKLEDKPFENLVIKFRNKIFDQINFNGIVRKCNNSFPLYNDCKIRIAFSYVKPLKSLVCNYGFYSRNIDLISENECYCNLDKYADYVDSFYGHVVTGNLNIVEDDSLKNYLMFGSKFRLNFNLSCKKVIELFEKELDIFILKLSYKYVWPLEDFKCWKYEVFKLFKEEYLFYANYFTKPKANNSDNKVNLLDSIKLLKNNFIISTVDKADNNFVFMCKAFYKKILLDEYIGNCTYNKLNTTPLAIKNRILAFSKKLKLNLNNSNIVYPYLFITTKFHKIPVKFRFVTCGSISYNYYAGKILFKLLNKVLLAISMDCDCFIINNNSKVLDYINKNSNDINSIKTYDFENLFSNIPHSNIISICNTIYDDFSNVIDCEKEYWINLIKFCIFENILFNGNSYFLQINGIPMGSCFSSAFANLFLYFYEKKFVCYDIKFFRYIDDIIVFNCENFLDLAKTVYPQDLTLKLTSSKDNISFLDLKIRLDKSTWFIGVYDKRLDFNFKVICLTNWNSCISIKVLKNILYSQIARINNICNNSDDLVLALRNLHKIAISNRFPSFILNNIFSER